MRYSHQRELILKEVCKRTDYPTAEQLCTNLRAACPRLSLGTVYRDLNTLVEAGKIRRVSVPGFADRFGSIEAPRQHLYCRVCRRIIDLPGGQEKLEALVHSYPEITAEDYSLTVFGVCADCAAQQNSGGRQAGEQNN